MRDSDRSSESEQQSSSSNNQHKGRIRRQSRSKIFKNQIKNNVQNKPSQLLMKRKRSTKQQQLKLNIIQSKLQEKKQKKEQIVEAKEDHISKIQDSKDSAQQIQNFPSNLAVSSQTFIFNKQMKKLTDLIQDKNPQLYVSRALKKQLIYNHKQSNMNAEQLQIFEQHQILKHFQSIKRQRDRNLKDKLKHGLFGQVQQDPDASIQETNLDTSSPSPLIKNHSLGTYDLQDFKLTNQLSNSQNVDSNQEQNTINQNDENQLNLQMNSTSLMRLEDVLYSGKQCRIPGLTHSAPPANQISAANHNYEQDHYFESTMQNTEDLEYIKLGGLQEDASIFWERINQGFFVPHIDHQQIKLLRNFYKLNPTQSQILKKYYLKKKSDKLQEFQSSQNNVPLNKKYESDFMSSDLDSDSDSIKNIIQFNDQTYEEINNMEPFHKIKNDPQRQSFLKDFQKELQKCEKVKEDKRRRKTRGFKKKFQLNHIHKKKLPN